MTRQLARVIADLEGHGIAAIAFKGPVLGASAFGDPALRQCGDLDILVRLESLCAALRLLLDAGYQLRPGETTPAYRRDSDYAITLLGPAESVAVDLHHKLLPSAFLGSLDLERSWARHGWLDLDGAKLRCLRPEDELLYLCMHGCKNWWHRLSWVCDVAEAIAAHRDLDWDDLASTARRARASRMLWLGALLARDLLGAPVPAEVLSVARADRPARTHAARIRAGLLVGAGTRDDDLARIHFHQSLAQGASDRLRYLGDVVRRYATPNERDRGLVALPRALDPLYYGIRAARLFWRHGIRRRTRTRERETEVDG